MHKSVILFIHGGPGLSSSYFRGWFSTLEDDYDLVFYDQNYNVSPNCSMLDSLVEELICNLRCLMNTYERVNVFAHSWGVYLALSALDRQRWLWDKIDKLILANPSDTTWDKFCASGDVLFARMPQTVIDKIAACIDGVELMKHALPYYVADPDNVPNVVIDRYDMAAYERVSGEMEGYNVVSLVSSLPREKVFTVYCENDFETPAGSPELLENSNVCFFAKAGHFPFAEYPAQYNELIARIIR